MKSQGQKRMDFIVGQRLLGILNRLWINLQQEHGGIILNNVINDTKEGSSGR